MAKMDEMQRAIRQNAKARGFDFMVVGLILLSLLRMGESISGGGQLDMRPIFVLMAVLAYSGLWDVYLTRRSTAGDDEYRQGTWKGWVVPIVCMLVILAVGLVVSRLF